MTNRPWVPADRVRGSNAAQRAAGIAAVLAAAGPLAAQDAEHTVRGQVAAADRDGVHARTAALPVARRPEHRRVRAPSGPGDRGRTGYVSAPRAIASARYASSPPCHRRMCSACVSRYAPGRKCVS